ncbi:hypothetical protein PSTT_13440 [Puccinia striiformis]|uniref:Uncharacterized protein n=1 Tax=Puccinia striiformis TaxID=27350 RepID=A0A2S4URN3_9BASI|nr:hypothetical protein PSTT_13440 [Puccinia striiformis]
MEPGVQQPTAGSQREAGNQATMREQIQQEWEDINNLNQVLKEFLDMMKHLEGDRPKLPMIVYEYIRLLDSLEMKKTAAISTMLKLMFEPMIEITKKYLKLALRCDTVVMATYLHPAWFCGRQKPSSTRKFKEPQISHHSHQSPGALATSA